MVLAASPALAIGRGGSMFSIQLMSGTADLYTPEAFSGNAGFISAYDHSEVGVSAEFWHMLSEDYAFAASFGSGFFSESNEPGDNALPGDQEFKYTQSSFLVRVGGDRVVKVGERGILYFGPGFQYWSGKAKFEQGISNLETEKVSRMSLNGRMGATMLVGPSWGLGGHIGHVIGRASAEDQGAKATWWPSSFEGAGGLVFLFGGE
jgi:hypothetical protein